MDRLGRNLAVETPGLGVRPERRVSRTGDRDQRWLRMRALSVVPLRAGSLSVEEVPEPQADDRLLTVAGGAVGVCGTDREIAAGSVDREIVLENYTVVGSVNANLAHYPAAVDSLAKTDLIWLGGLITRRVTPARFREAFAPEADDVKVVLTLGDGS
jgi:threonine dehydrogenase-like Zn-dependent dehydrogenase